MKTKEVVIAINKELSKKNTIIRVKKGDLKATIEITVIDDIFVSKDTYCNLKSNFYPFLVRIVKKVGIKSEITFNNSGKIFWCINNEGQHWN